LIFASKLFLGSWDWGGSVCYLVFKANQQFVASSGEIVQPAVYRRVTCVVTGRDRAVPLIADIPPTTDAMPGDASFDIYFEDAGHTKKDDLIKGASLPHTYPNPVQWQDIIEFNNPQFVPGPNREVSYDQMALYVRNQIALISSPILATGIGTLNVLGADQPVTILDSHVSANSPIDLMPRADTITGDLRVSNRVAGVSFDVTSSNGADAGNFTWVIYP
jgi:hypothetical protein